MKAGLGLVGILGYIRLVMEFEFKCKLIELLKD